MTIIGLVGRSGSGKDTVASYIAPVHLVRVDGSFVDVRKRVAAELLSVRMKEAGLDKVAYELSRQRMGNGRADEPLPALRPHAVQVALADPMKVFLHQLYDLSFLTLWGPSKFRNQDDQRYQTKDPTDYVVHYLNPRKALQQLGTEWGRAQWEGTWVNAGIKFARELLDKQHIKKPDDAHTFAPNWTIGRHDLVVFSDIRFQNEVEMIHEGGGQVWRINRDTSDGIPAIHASEVQDLEGVDLEIMNVGTLGDLRDRVQVALEGAGL